MSSKKSSKDGHFCNYYAFDEHGQRRVFSWRVTNKQDAVHCLVRMGQASGYYVERVGGINKTNERIYASARNPDYKAPHEKTWWEKMLSD